MSYSSSPYYTRTHGSSSGGVYGKPTSSSNMSGGSSDRPATLNLVSSAAKIISQSQQAISKPTPSTTTTTTFATMGSSMIFHPKPSRYASPTVLPSIPSKASSVTNLPNPTGTSSVIATSPPNSIVSSQSPYYTQPKPPIMSFSSSKPLSSVSQQQHHQPVITVPPKSGISNLSVGYGRSSIPYYQTKMSSSQNVIGEREGAAASSGHFGHEMNMTMNPLNKSSSSNISERSGGGVGTGSSSTQNLSNIGSASTLPSSKSTHQLILDSIPNVFCLSCPPAEFKFSDAYRAKTLPRTGKENERLIGFATLPEQVHRKSVKKGFDFTLMAVGESGLGKSTLINSLFLADFYQNRKIPSANDQINRTTTIQKHTIEIEERGVKLRLTVVDTPGFGDAINCEESWKTCVDYIDDQFHQYFQAESGLDRRHIQDTRVHCCLYFVPPYGRGLRPLDLIVIKNLQHRVNVIPIIAKSDTLTTFEVRKMKDQILLDLKSNQIQIYQFPECDEEEDDEFKRQDRELKASVPFAVASSLIFVDGRRGRQYPWGTVEVENPSHSDFGKLRTMLIQSHMHDLKETTQDLHYENFRAKAIAQISQGRNARERTKLKRDSSSDSPQELLIQKEAEIKKMQQMISKMEAKLKAQTYKPTSRDSIIDL